MKPGTRNTAAAAALCLFACLSILMSVATGCGGSPGKPTLISFMGEESESAQKMLPIIENLKEKYGDRVIFKDVDMEDPASEGDVEKYHVTMSPTFVVLNADGEVKETFMGAAHEEMLLRALESYLPADDNGTAAPGPPPSVDAPAPGLPSPVPGLPEGIPPQPVVPEGE